MSRNPYMDGSAGKRLLVVAVVPSSAHYDATMSTEAAIDKAIAADRAKARIVYG